MGETKGTLTEVKAEKQRGALGAWQALSAWQGLAALLRDTGTPQSHSCPSVPAAVTYQALKAPEAFPVL